MGCSGCAGMGMVYRRRAFEAPVRRASEPTAASGAGTCAGGCGCGGTCSLPDPAPVGAGAVMSESGSLAARQTRAALDYQRVMGRGVMGRGAGLTPVEDRLRYSDISDAELQRGLQAAITRGDDAEYTRISEILTDREEGRRGGDGTASEARFTAMSSAKRAAIARDAAREAGADEAQTAAAVSAAVTQGLAALNAYLAGTFRVRIAEINSARDISIARLGSEERVRLRILSSGQTAPGSTSTSTTNTVAAVGGLGLLFLLAKGAR